MGGHQGQQHFIISREKERGLPLVLVSIERYVSDARGTGCFIHFTSQDSQNLQARMYFHHHMCTNLRKGIKIWSGFCLISFKSL